MAKPKKLQGKALHKELVFQTAEGSALSFVFDQKKKKQKTKQKQKNSEWREGYPNLMPKRSP